MPQNGIELSVSPWASPVVLVKKVDKTLQLCIDYRNLNKSNIKDSYPLPHIQDTLHMLYGNNLFAALDLLKVYHQIEFQEISLEKTAFTAHVGLFQYICLPFGPTSTLPSFQRLLEHVLRGYIGNFVILYIDDILIFSSTFEYQLSHVTQVFKSSTSQSANQQMLVC